jgi:hypothetical protein
MVEIRAAIPPAYRDAVPGMSGIIRHSPEAGFADLPRHGREPGGSEERIHLRNPAGLDQYVDGRPWETISRHLLWLARS